MTAGVHAGEHIVDVPRQSGDIGQAGDVLLAVEDCLIQVGDGPPLGEVEAGPVSSGDYTWASSYENSVWTYSLEEVWKGLKAALSAVENREQIAAAGVSAMMHGYLAFDRDWNLLAPFRTWQNTITGQAAAELTSLFGFNIPQRWSIAHLYQAILNGEEHVSRLAHITTLAGYVHYMLTGVNAVGVGGRPRCSPRRTPGGTFRRWTPP